MYSKDSFNAYYNGVMIKNAYPLNFSILNDNYAKDSFNVYYKGKVIPNVFTSKFEVLDYDYAKDVFNVYYKDKIIPGANPMTFEIPRVNSGFGRNFSEYVTDITIYDDGVLEAYLKHGRRKRVYIDLNNYIGNNDGNFDLNGENFSDTSKNFRITHNGRKFSAYLQDKDGIYNKDSIMLDNILGIKNRKIIVNKNKYEDVYEDVYEDMYEDYVCNIL